MESRYYPGVEADVIKLMTELRSLFDEDYDVQTMQVSSTAVLQARKSSTLREITGLSAALTIKITPETGGTRVEMGMQKWFDKAAVAAVAFLVSGVLIALPALGAYWQYKLTEDAWKIIEDHIARKAGGYVPPLPGRCGTCGAARELTMWKSDKGSQSGIKRAGKQRRRASPGLGSDDGGKSLADSAEADRNHSATVPGTTDTDYL